jgi:hypothetical protein
MAVEVFEATTCDVADNFSMPLLWKVTPRIGGTDQMAGWDRGYEAYDTWSKALKRKAIR